MEETKYIWINGKLILWGEAKVHVLTHGLHYGSGVFEGIRVYETDKGPAIFRLEEHIARLFRSAGVFRMKIPFTEENLNNATVQTVKENQIKSGYIRPIAFLGYGKMGLDPKGAGIDVVIATWPWGSYLGEDAVRVKIPSIRRIHPQTTHPEAKICGNYQNSILASLEVKEAGYDEALLLDCNGNVAEGPGENFFIVKDGKLITPSLGNILPGITRDTLITVAKDIGIGAEEKTLKLEDIVDADEAFFCGTAAEVTPIHSIDDHEFKQAPGELTKRLGTMYFDIVHGKNRDYNHWLTFVK